jgi:antitoxin HicB
MSKPNFDDYDFEIRRIKPDDGGGFSITFPDLPGCMSDGDTTDEALANGREAFDAWMSTCIAEGRTVPAPGSQESAPVKFVQRVAKYMHEELSAAARTQGVSVNTLVVGFIADGLSKLETRRETNKVQPKSRWDDATIDLVSGHQFIEGVIAHSEMTRASTGWKDLVIVDIPSTTQIGGARIAGSVTSRRQRNG